MSIWEVILTGIALSMDAFAVALCKGLAMKTFLRRSALLIAGSFGLFQALMPLLGWLAGAGFIHAIEAVDHWIAFGLLFLVGGKMLLDAIRESKKEPEHEEKARQEESGKKLKIGELMLLSVATSIDALAVGLTLAMLGTTIRSSSGNISIWVSIAVIGTETFLLSYGGVFIGHRFGSRLEYKAQILGGIVLILIGVRILLSHLL